MGRWTSPRALLGVCIAALATLLGACAARAEPRAEREVVHGPELLGEWSDPFAIKTSGIHSRYPLRVPANRRPPGYYVLFIVDADGVPSAASWVRLN
jgi:Domain of unknown function (DUF1929)